MEDCPEPRGHEQGPLFFKASQTGLVGTKLLSPRGVYDVLGEQLRQAGMAHASRTTSAARWRGLAKPHHVRYDDAVRPAGQRRLGEASRNLHFECFRGVHSGEQEQSAISPYSSLFPLREARYRASSAGSVSRQPPRL